MASRSQPALCNAFHRVTTVRIAPDTSPRSPLELEGRVKPRWAFVGLAGDDGTALHLRAPLKLRGGAMPWHTYSKPFDRQISPISPNLLPTRHLD